MKAWIIITFLILLSGSGYGQFRSDGCGCAIPIADTTAGAERFIPIADMMQKISPDGKKLAYVVNQGDGGGYVLDLTTLQRKEIIVHGGLSGEQDLGIFYPTWCPYDPDLLAFIVPSLIDTTHSGNPTVYVSNLFTYRISTGESKLITPEKYKKEGIGVAQLFGWTNGSRLGIDTFIISRDTSTKIGIAPKVLYNQQTQTINYVPGNTMLVAQSKSGNIIIGITDDIPPYNNGHLYLNQTEIHAPRIIQNLNHSSFSPNSKLVALTVDPAGVGGGGNILHDNYWDTVFQQVWIFNADDPSPDNVKIINFQCLYCMYNFWGAWAEFLTDSTLAVSMHKDGDTNSWLWEITIDGRIVRQLTGVPQNNEAVQPNPLSEHTLKLWPSIATSEITIASDQNILHLIIVDILGRIVLEKNYITGDEKEIEIPTTDLITGSYIARIFTGKSFEQCSFIVKH